MNTKALAEMVGLPPKAVAFLLDNKIVALPLQEEDLFFMHKYAEVWGKRELIRLQIAPINRKERTSILLGAGYNKTENYVIKRLHRHYDSQTTDAHDGGNDDGIVGNCEGRAKRGVYLHIDLIVDEVMTHYKIPKNMRNKIVAIARKMRKKVSNDRYRSADVVEISRNLNSYKKAVPRKTTKKQQVTSAEAMKNIFGI